MILQPKRPNSGFIFVAKRSAEIELPRASMTASGRYQLIVRDAWGKEKRRTPWFDNIILDSGLNRWGTGGVIAGAAIGTGTSTPLASQNSLDTQVHWTSTPSPSTGATSALGSSPYYNTITYIYRTTLGSLNGNYTEVGVGWASGSMFSRALILDGGGSPTTISISSAEQLDIVYQLRIYPPLVDIGPTTVTISGVSYDVTGRAANVNQINHVGWYPSGGSAMAGSIASYSAATFGDVMGAITASPTGTSGGAATGSTTSAYSSGSYTANADHQFPLAQGNITGGIKSSLMFWGVATFQYQYSTKIPKDNTKTLVLNYSLTWARRP